MSISRDCPGPIRQFQVGETGLIARSEIPGFMRSVRCEMATFYQANASLPKIYKDNMAAADRWTRKAVANPRERAEYLQRAAVFREMAVLEGKNFPVSSALSVPSIPSVSTYDRAGRFSSRGSRSDKNLDARFLQLFYGQTHRGLLVHGDPALGIVECTPQDRIPTSKTSSHQSHSQMGVPMHGCNSARRIA